MPVQRALEKGGSSLKIYPDIFRLAKIRKIEVEIFSDDKVLNPFSAIRLLFKAEGKVLLEKETILKCDNLDECFFCFNQNFTYIILEKVVSEKGKEKKEKVSIPIVWHCLNWEGKPIFEEEYFEECFLNWDKILGVRKSLLEILAFNRLSVEEKGNLVKIVADDKRFFTSKLYIEGINEGVVKFFDNNVVCLHDNS